MLLPPIAPEVSTNAVMTRYLRATLERSAAWSMDMLARMSILEGAAGVPPGSWLSHRERGFGLALNHFGPNLAAGWTSATDQGLYSQAVKEATHALRDTAGTDGEELVQELVSHSSTSSGPKRLRIFYAIGESLSSHKRNLSDGSVTPEHRTVRGQLLSWVRRSTLDVLESWHAKKITPVAHPEQKTTGLSPDERENLLLLALQSPGGAGTGVRRTINTLIDQHFTVSERAVVRLFLEKIAQPKYRSVATMREMVQSFDVNKWFMHAFKQVRREILESTGVSAQRLTNILGRDAAKVFTFMSNVVGKDSHIKKVLGELAEEIELLEPGLGYRMSSEARTLLATIIAGSSYTPASQSSVTSRVANRWLQAQPVC